MRILHKLSLSFASVFLLLALSSSLFVWFSLKDLLVSDLEREARDLASKLAGLSRELIQTGDTYALYELAYLIQSHDAAVRYVVVLDHNGKVMVHTFPSIFPKDLLNQNPVGTLPKTSSNIVTFKSNEGVIHDTLYPIEQGDLGYIRIGLNEKQINKILFSNVSKLGLIAFILGTITLVIVLWLAKRLTSPLHTLARVTETIAQGTLPNAIPVSGKDEIGQLGRTIHVMVTNLKRHQAHERHLRQRLISTQENERKRISRELHDETGQALTGLMFSMRATINQTQDENLRHRIINFRDQVFNIMTYLRRLATELRPPLLEEMPLASAIQKYIEEYQVLYGIPVEFHHTNTSTSSSNVEETKAEKELTVYRILQESLTNIARHAQASAAFVSLREGGDTVLIIKDNGIGLLPDMLETARRNQRYGLSGIQERVGILQGHFNVTSEPPFWTTVLTVTLPA